MLDGDKMLNKKFYDSFAELEYFINYLYFCVNFVWSLTEWENEQKNQVSLNMHLPGI